jgi:hypothetical protein
MFWNIQKYIYICVLTHIIMGTNYYRIPKESEMNEKKTVLLDRITYLNLSVDNIETGFRTISPTKDWDWISPWDEFINGTKIHLGKRSNGWKFCWNFHDNKYYSNKEELFEFIRSGRIVDEYGSEWFCEEFILMAETWFIDGLVVNEEYRRKERAKGHGSFWLDNEKYDDLIIDGLRVSSSTDFC